MVQYITEIRCFC
jgi:hypothetical protein